MVFAGQGKVKDSVYDAGARPYPGTGLRPQYRSEGQTPYGANIGAGMGADPASAKYGGAGKQPYGGAQLGGGVEGKPGKYAGAGPLGVQPSVPLAGTYDGSSKAGKYGAGQLPYNGQPIMPAGLGGDYAAGKYGAGQPQYDAQTGVQGGLGVDPSAAKYGAGQLPYGAQAGVQGGLGVDPSAGKYGAAQLPYGGQPVVPTGLDGTVSNMGYLNGDDQPAGLAPGTLAPLQEVQGHQPLPEYAAQSKSMNTKSSKAGYAQLGAGQIPNPYGGKESKYGMNGYLGNGGYRGGCANGKC
ncbi:elastin-like [Pleurodeles waltl]|uniref:elastin-like n=1 Tax=Pleurodeles waltl TaxID=8319 RepID=UPI0037096945